MKHLLLPFALLLLPAMAVAQSAPVYEYLTFIESESRNSNEAKLLFIPAFQGKDDLKLASLSGPYGVASSELYRRNVQVVTQQLAAASAQGWELVGFTGANGMTEGGETRYLLRRVKR